MSSHRAPETAHRSRRAHRAILGATLELVHEVGYPRVTIEGVAARAGVGKQTIYRRWPSKAAILRDAVVSLTEDIARAGGAVRDTGDLEADLKAVLRSAVDTMTDPGYDVPARALVAAGIADPALGKELTARLVEPPLRLCLERLGSARGAGQIAQDVDPRIAVLMLAGPVAQHWLMGDGPLTHEYTDALVDLALRGLAPR
ncbi:TetR/AcrR family transcriptional regulator [Streptomyces spiramyceticus]|uniref:TetR n=1 Tax=Streptomyces spiramyceticus TaxID=299717 RepID=A0A411PXC3_9ACTN|nr:TetR/AcrR family transcriptional regulator [Streptomyces spiramyceticus]QBG49755.1 TetR [Streptomyces spiramyceticus]